MTSLRLVMLLILSIGEVLRLRVLIILLVLLIMISLRLITHNLVFFNVVLLMSDVLSLRHLPALLAPLLLTHSHLLLLLCWRLYVMVCVLMRILIHIVDVDVLLTFIVHMSVARDSLKFLYDELFRLTFFSLASACVQRIDLLNCFKLIRLRSNGVLKVLRFSFTWEINLMSITILPVTTSHIVWTIIKYKMPLNATILCFCISLYWLLQMILTYRWLTFKLSFLTCDVRLCSSLLIQLIILLLLVYTAILSYLVVS
jgi:hypothetical protein